MLLNICNQEIDTKDIKNITLTGTAVLIDTEEEYYSLRYTDRNEVKDAELWLKFYELTRKELMQAVNTIMITCDYFINQKEQCSECPLQKKEGCVFTHIPIEWRT